jgi:hypothetical protein
MFDGAKVLAAKPEQSGSIKLGIAANAVVRMGVEWIAVSIMPDFFGLVFPLNVYGAGAPVVFFARHVLTALEQKNPLPGRRQLSGERPAAGAGADDDHVIVPFIVH